MDDPEHDMTMPIQVDASISGDLIRFDDDEQVLVTQSSNTDYQDDLKEFLEVPVKQAFVFELSPATPNYEARFQEDIDEAMRRSLEDTKALASKEEEMLPLSDDEDAQELHKLSIEKVEGWMTDSKITSTLIGNNVIHPADNPSDWEIKATPKTIKNRAALPRSSFLTLQRSEPTDKSTSPIKGKDKTKPTSTDSTPVRDSETTEPINKGRPQVKGNKKTFAQVTRTFDPESDTVTVSNLPQRRRGRGNKPAYLDITRELHYRR